MHAPSLFVGVDGGQTSTEAVIGDSGGRLLGRGRGGPCNHASRTEGEARLRRAVAEAVGSALDEAGVAWPTRWRAACLGMSGGPDDKRHILSELLPADSVAVVTDAEVALEGAAPGLPGAIVIAGTGAIALARDSDGRMARCGGWGYVFGDEGGAFDIARRAMRASLAWEEGWGPRTALAPFLMEASGSSSVHQALHRLYAPDWPRERVAALAAGVDKVAKGGDPCACQIMVESGLGLAELAGRALGCLSASGSGVRIYPLGGAFRSRLLRGAFEAGCSSLGREIGRPKHDGPVGALLMAYRAAHVALPAGGVR